MAQSKRLELSISLVENITPDFGNKKSKNAKTHFVSKELLNFIRKSHIVLYVSFLLLIRVYFGKLQNHPSHHTD